MPQPSCSLVSCTARNTGARFAVNGLRQLSQIIWGADSGGVSSGSSNAIPVLSVPPFGPHFIRGQEGISGDVSG